MSDSPKCHAHTAPVCYTPLIIQIADEVSAKLHGMALARYSMPVCIVKYRGSNAPRTPENQTEALIVLGARIVDGQSVVAACSHQLHPTYHSRTLAPLYIVAGTVLLLLCVATPGTTAFHLRICITRTKFWRCKNEIFIAIEPQRFNTFFTLYWASISHVVGRGSHHRLVM